MARPITRTNPRTIRSGPLAGYTFTTERTYRQALAAVRGAERYRTPKRLPGQPPSDPRARAVRAYQRVKRDAGEVLSYNQISQSPEFKRLWAEVKPTKGGSRQERRERQKRRQALIAEYFAAPEEFWTFYHQLAPQSAGKAA